MEYLVHLTMCELSHVLVAYSKPFIKVKPRTTSLLNTTYTNLVNNVCVTKPIHEYHLPMSHDTHVWNNSWFSSTLPPNQITNNSSNCLAI